MGITEATKRLEWRFYECNIIYVNEKDKLAFQEILQFHRFLETNFLSKTKPLFNLYTYTLSKLLIHYKTSIINPIPHRELHRIMTRPIDNSISDLTSLLNQFEQNQVLNTIENTSLNQTKHPVEFSESEQQLAILKIQHLLQSETSKKRLFGTFWDFMEVKNGMLNQFKNFCSEHY
ncbi:hypothetical protein ACFSQJ_15950 [Croceitalea marina]|uniref:Uncharacterized protein n=1 Tax=Croceitalea marina TaxID=1775166 RepID=A0ABW5MYY3_9FLAO